MPNTVPFKLITPTKVIFDGEAELVIAMTTEGEEGILPQHAPFLGALKPGCLRANVRENDSTKRLELATSAGFMQALPDRVTVLVDEAVAFDDIDVAATRKELFDATERMKSASGEQLQREQAVIDYANAKLRITGHG
jgi:F-type H+-transporting ATPase subunit epsilon